MSESEVVRGRLAILEGQVASLEENIRRKRTLFISIRSGIEPLLPIRDDYQQLITMASNVQGLMLDYPQPKEVESALKELMQTAEASIKDQVKKDQEQQLLDYQRELALADLKARKAKGETFSEEPKLRRDADLAG